jgi:hypothetical protein
MVKRKAKVAADRKPWVQHAVKLLKTSPTKHRRLVSIASLAGTDERSIRSLKKAMNLASVLAPSAVAYIDKQLRRKYPAFCLRQRGGKTHNPSSASSLPLMCNFTAAGRALLLRLY